jgi:GAF domain-containing protein/HAMP domain-containing protein
MAVVFAAISLFSAAAFAYIAYLTQTFQPAMAACLMLISFIIASVCRNDHMIRSQTWRVFLPLGALEITLISCAILFMGASLPIALAILTLSFFVSATVLDGTRTDNGIFLGVVAAGLAALAGVFKPVTPVDVGTVSHLGYLITLVVACVFVYLFRRNQVSFPLRLRLITSALVIVILPVTILSFINNNSMKTREETENYTSLESSAKLFAQRVDEFVLANRASIAAQSYLPIYSRYLHLNSKQRPGSPEETAVMTSIESYRAALKVKERAFLTSIAILDLDGKVVYTSNKEDISRWDEVNTDFFRKPIETGVSYASDVVFSPVDNTPYIFFSGPIRDTTSSIIGVLRVKFQARIFQKISEEYTGSLEEARYPILLDEDYIRLAQPSRPQLLFQSLVPLEKDRLKVLVNTGRMPAVLHSTNLTEMAAYLDNYQEMPHFTGWSDSNRTDQMAVVKLYSRQWYVVFLQDESVLQAQLAEQANLAVLIATILATVVSLVTLRVARAFSDPLNELTTSALEISNGNLSAKTPVKGFSEFRLLGQTFELMARQIQQMIAGLEDRVQERTRELARQNDALTMRAKQFETVAEVARGVASAQELQELLDKVTVLVSERFGFQHTGIFLLDDAREYAVLRAASSEGGARMLARQHRLQVGQAGIVGYVTSVGEPRIATDVGQDAVYFNNPDLPATRSEMALPLKVGQEIIGALDVQSNEPDAFSEEDTQLFAILADQIAIAIYNHRLYSETSLALTEAQLVHRRYLQQEWSKEETMGQHTAYRYFNSATAPNQSVDLPDIQSAIEFGEPVAAQEGDARILTVPVKLRGEIIAVIRVQENAEGGLDWHSEEVEMVNEVADQVALALENARLFTQTSRRAERERKVLEITSKIREHNDPQTMLQVAVEELQNALKASRAQVVLQSQISVGVHAGEHGNGNGNGNGNNGNGHHGND